MKTDQYSKSKIMKIIGIIGIISAIITALVSAFSGYLFVKLFRFISTAQKALPRIDKAAQLYIQNNTKTKPDNKA